MREKGRRVGGEGGGCEGEGVVDRTTQERRKESEQRTERLCRGGKREREKKIDVTVRKKKSVKNLAKNVKEKESKGNESRRVVVVVVVVVV